MTAPDQTPATADTSAAGSRPLARVPIRLRWRDLDAFNHVNNASFLTFLEEARLAWLSGIGGEWTGEACMPVLAATQLNYRRQLGWPGEVVVELSAQRIGNSSLTIGHRIVSADSADLLYADGSVVMVWVDPASGVSMPLPAAVRSACEQPV